MYFRLVEAPTRPSLVVADNTLQCSLTRMIAGCKAIVADSQGLCETSPVGLGASARPRVA
ncbi:MAG: hypothetical protein DRI90_12805 [Deltaproteobacteria bacterium]|nr:MAG: hypothetical protein DRI90_12805 [Deltaproteobacteria bacterium]